MFDLVLFAIGLIATIVLAFLEAAESIAIGWLWVLAPAIASIVIILIKHGFDITDILSD